MENLQEFQFRENVSCSRLFVNIVGACEEAEQMGQKKEIRKVLAPLVIHVMVITG